MGKRKGAIWSWMTIAALVGVVTLIGGCASKPTTSNPSKTLFSNFSGLFGADAANPKKQSQSTKEPKSTTLVGTQAPPSSKSQSQDKSQPEAKALASSKKQADLKSQPAGQAQVAGLTSSGHASQTANTQTKPQQRRTQASPSAPVVKVDPQPSSKPATSQTAQASRSTKSSQDKVPYTELFGSGSSRQVSSAKQTTAASTRSRRSTASARSTVAARSQKTSSRPVASTRSKASKSSPSTGGMIGTTVSSKKRLRYPVTPETIQPRVPFIVPARRGESAKTSSNTVASSPVTSTQSTHSADSPSVQSTASAKSQAETKQTKGPTNNQLASNAPAKDASVQEKSAQDKSETQVAASNASRPSNSSTQGRRSAELAETASPKPASQLADKSADDRPDGEDLSGKMASSRDSSAGEQAAGSQSTKAEKSSQLADSQVKDSPAKKSQWGESAEEAEQIAQAGSTSRPSHQGWRVAGQPDTAGSGHDPQIEYGFDFVLALIQQARAKYAKVRNYEAHLVWQNSQGGQLGPHNHVAFRCRTAGNALQIGWDPDPKQGRQWLYAPLAKATSGKDRSTSSAAASGENTLLVREETSYGWLKRQVPVDDAVVLAVRPKPVNRWGIEPLIKELEQAAANSQSRGRDRLSVHYDGLKPLSRETALMHRVVVVDEIAESRKEYYFEPDSGLPVASRSIEADGEITEVEHYRDLAVDLRRLDSPLAFDPRLLSRR